MLIPVVALAVLTVAAEPPPAKAPTRPPPAEKAPALMPKATDLLDQVDVAPPARLPAGAPGPGDVIGGWEIVTVLGPLTPAQAQLENGMPCGYRFGVEVRSAQAKGAPPVAEPARRATVGVLCALVTSREPQKGAVVLGAAAFAMAIAGALSSPAAHVPLVGVADPKNAGALQVPAHKKVRPSWILTFEELPPAAPAPAAR